MQWNTLKTRTALTIAALLIVTSLFTPTLAETEGGAPSLEPPGSMEGQPGEPPDGNMGDMPGIPPEGGMLGEPPDGMGSAPSGQSGQPASYDAVQSFDSDAQISGAIIESTGADENAVLVTAGEVSISGGAISRVSDASTGGDASSFYGVGAAVLTTGGTLTVEDSMIATDASGGAGVFAYGDGVACVSNTTISTTRDTSGGIHVAGGGTLYASNLTVTTKGESSAAIRSDRGGGVMMVDAGSYTTSGLGSPAVYVTADITIQGAALTASGSEALCLEGRNSVRLYDCALSSSMQDLEQNDNTWSVILYQSMSGDSEIGKGYFEMDGGALTSSNGGLFYTTNTQSEFVLRNVTIEAAEDSEYFLRCTGNNNQRGWGSSGSNGANCIFTAIDQTMSGLVVWDSISTLDLYITEESALIGAVIDDESCAGSGGDGACSVTIDANSSWIVTSDSKLTSLNCAGIISDAEGNAVSILGTDGTVYVEGAGISTITVENYSTEVNLVGAGSVSSF